MIISIRNLAFLNPNRTSNALKGTRAPFNEAHIWLEAMTLHPPGTRRACSGKAWNPPASELGGDREFVQGSCESYLGFRGYFVIYWLAILGSLAAWLSSCLLGVLASRLDVELPAFSPWHLENPRSKLDESPENPMAASTNWGSYLGVLCFCGPYMKKPLISAPGFWKLPKS